MSSLMGLATLALSPQTANATTATTSFMVTATVQSTCTVSATALAFGTYTGAVANSTSTISVTCSNSTAYNVALGVGLATNATVTTRQMSLTTSLLNYGLYQDTNHTTNWGLTDGTDDVAGTGNGSAQSITVYGQIAAGQYPAPGMYSDTIAVTVTY